MQILAINNFQQNKQPNFKSTIPVYHWVREAGNRFDYKLVNSKEISQILQEKIVGIFNRPNNINHSFSAKMAVKTLKESDLYYSLRLRHNDYSKKKNTPTRSFYNPKGGWNYNLTKFSPISYLITGIDVDYFNNNFAKPLGMAKAEEKEMKDKAASANLKMAWHNYFVNGLEFVKDKKHQIKDLYDVPYGMHTKFVAIRDDNGHIIKYDFEDLRLLPEEGTESPIVKLALRNRK